MVYKDQVLSLPEQFKLPEQNTPINFLNAELSFVPPGK